MRSPLSELKSCNASNLTYRSRPSGPSGLGGSRSAEPDEPPIVEAQFDSEPSEGGPETIRRDLVIG